MFSKTFLISLLVYSLSIYSYGQEDKKFFRKDYTYIESTEAFYKVNTAPSTWFEAKKQCAIEDAGLFYPEDEHEAKTVISFWNGSQPLEGIFVGISDLVVEGVFETIDGKPISSVYVKWAPGDPNNNDNAEDCVTLKKDGLYNDISCSNKYPFVCKKSLHSVQWNPSCNIPSLDYRFNETLGSCYKLHSTPMTWVDAYTVCAAEQSYLTIINSRAEAEFVLKLAQGTPVHPSAGSYTYGVIHSGFHNRLNEGWQTVKGTPLTENGYDCWDNKQPPGYGNEQRGQCGAILFNACPYPMICDTKSVFVCEHDVDVHGPHYVVHFGDVEITH